MSCSAARLTCSSDLLYRPGHRPYRFRDGDGGVAVRGTPRCPVADGHRHHTGPPAGRDIVIGVLRPALGDFQLPVVGLDRQPQHQCGRQLAAGGRAQFRGAAGDEDIEQGLQITLLGIVGDFGEAAEQHSTAVVE